MELVWLVYGIGLLGDIIGLIGGLIIVCGIIAFFYFVSGYEPNFVKAKPWLITALILCIFMAVLPSEKTAYTMVGAYAAQRLAQSPEVQQMSGKVLTIIEQQMDKYIAEGAKVAK